MSAGLASVLLAVFLSVGMAPSREPLFVAVLTAADAAPRMVVSMERSGVLRARMVKPWKLDAGKGLEIEDTELKIQFALSAIPPQSYHEWMRIGGMIACALRGVVDDDGRGLWEEWANEVNAYKWSECMTYTAFNPDGRSLFFIADQHDPERLWRRAYETALDKLTRGKV